MIAGQPVAGSTPVDLDANRVRGLDFTLAEAAHLSHITVLLDGGGPGSGAALARAVLYDAADVLLARGDEVSIADGAAAAWVQLRFEADGGLLVAAGDYRAGLHLGGVSEAARTFVDDPGTDGSWEATDVYADGTAATLPADTPLTAGMPLIVSLFEPWVEPAVDDLELTRLPFGLAQASLGATGVLRATRTAAVAGWHGTFLDPEHGAVAIVRSDGPLAELVGERVRVSTRDGRRSVAVYVNDEQDFPDELAAEDLSLSRRAFLALAPWCTEALEVTVETFG